MKSSNQIDLIRLSRCLVVFILFSLGAAATARADAIVLNTFHQFSFTNAGVLARGCDPADPLGPFCIPSSGTPTQFAPAPPWTFSSPAAVLLTVTDAFEVGERFEVFDFGVSLGLTSAPGVSGDCGDDPIPCLANPSISSRVFSLVAGNHSITIVPVLSPFGGGSAYFRATAVPEPGTVLLLGLGLSVFGFRKLKNRL